MDNKTKQDALAFLMSQKGGVVSTVGKEGPESAFVFYDADEDFSIYFATSVNSRKNQNIKINKKVAFVVNTIEPPKTIQIEGEISEVQDKEILKNSLANYVDVASYGMKENAPVTKIDSFENFVMYRIKPNWVNWSDYSESNGGALSIVIINNK
ncbi:MAG TPA: pyridoxamine 5'-phosphate oxidase family protein [Parcubacteria group bacterium]|jgi:nitroimidazol reductase NimA-like FMN-containing flavoprotein (pyridoxamine 5'-phosphate oxidase superfamily)|nr:pyridoxamine 5'-phosphate oxidase family protein [Parcubacteria group bacterium]